MATNSALLKKLQGMGLNVQAQRTPTNPLPATPIVSAIKQAVSSWRNRKPSSNRPRPPVSTGPIINPQGQLRAQTAAKRGYTDNARRTLSRTPIDYRDSYSSEIPAYGAYSPDTGRIAINKTHNFVPRSTPKPAWEPVLAHEFGHKWGNDWGVYDNLNLDNYQADTQALAGINPGVQRSMDRWELDKSRYASQNDPLTGLIETHGRVAEEAQPGTLPRWYAEKYYPGMYQQFDERVREGPIRNPGPKVPGPWDIGEWWGIGSVG